MNKTRRVVAVGALAASLVTSAGLAGPAHAASPPQSAPRVTGGFPVAAMTADSFVNSIGVATHLTYGDTAYGNLDLVAQRLAQLGVKHLRDGWGTGSAWASSFAVNTLGPLGIKLTMVQDPRLNATPEQLKDMVKSQLLPVIDAAESLNEFDTQGGSWATTARDWTIAMSQAYRSDPATAGIPLIGPSLADTNNAANHAAMGDLSPYVDEGNTHDYPGDAYQMTDHILDVVQANVGLMVPGKPIVATETGFSNGTVDEPYPAMPEAQAAVVLPRLYLDSFRRGIARTFSYELMDETSNGSFESGFGLLHSDGSVKPAFNAMAGLIGLLADPGPAFTPTPLPLSVKGGDASTRTELLQKRDGSYYLAIWEQDPVWNGTSVLTPPSVPVTIGLPGPATATVYGLKAAAAAPAALRSVARTSSITVASSANVKIVKISGLGPVAPAWTMRINCGGATTTENGVTFQADRYYLGGNVASSSDTVASTSTPTVDADERWALSGYRIPVPAAGTYAVRLHFLESAFSRPGQRVFDVTAEGTPIATGLDIAALTGGKDRGYQLTVPVTVRNGFLDLGFVAHVDNPTISAIEVVRTS